MGVCLFECRCIPHTNGIKSNERKKRKNFKLNIWKKMALSSVLFIVKEKKILKKKQMFKQKRRKENK